MQTLNLDPKLSPAPIKRPASQFPEPADMYFCDQCRRDITSHLHRGRAHVRQPLGPVRYVCRCGQSYVSGATEWDYLSDWNQGYWLSDVRLIFILLAIVVAYGTLVYFAVVHRSFITISLSFVSIPFALASLLMLVLIFPIPFQIAASIMRTRAFRKR
jgi:hypothetical protein